MNYQKLLLEFENQLDQLEKENEDILGKAENGKKIVERCLLKLCKEVFGKPFPSQSAEIEFFKNIKPMVFSKLIYYDKVFDIECKRPRDSDQIQIKYYKKQMSLYETFFSYNIEFYNYYRRGATSKDDKYFVRGNHDLSLPMETYHFITDKEFSTAKDETVSFIMAYDMLIVYLQQEIDRLRENLEPQNSEPMNINSGMVWTGSKTDLVELLYALHASRIVNGGNMDIKEMVAHFEQMFNVDLGQFYHTYMEIRARKTSRTRCLDQLGQNLIQRMDAKDKEKD